MRNFAGALDRPRAFGPRVVTEVPTNDVQNGRVVVEQASTLVEHTDSKVTMDI